jgi:hypothetical protein
LAWYGKHDIWFEGRAYKTKGTWEEGYNDQPWEVEANEFMKKEGALLAEELPVYRDDARTIKFLPDSDECTEWWIDRAAPITTVIPGPFTVKFDYGTLAADLASIENKDIPIKVIKVFKNREGNNDPNDNES